MATITRPPKGDSYKRLNALLEQFKITAQDLPNRTFKINPGLFNLEDGTLIEYIGGTSPIINAPSSGARWDLVSISNTGILTITSGASSSNPQLPAVPVNHLPVSLIYYEYNDAYISNDMIYDIRPFLKVGTRSINHNDSLDRNNTSAHTISSIVNLQTELDNRPLLTNVQDLINPKCDSIGTDNTSFILNKDESGTPADNVSLVVERGAETNVDIRWNETSDVWEFTNDGSNYYPLSTTSSNPSDSSTTVKGVTKLSTAPVLSTNPIAVGDNDTRLLSNLEKTNTLTHTSNSDIHFDDLTQKTSVVTTVPANLLAHTSNSDIHFDDLTQKNTTVNHVTNSDIHFDDLIQKDSIIAISNTVLTLTGSVSAGQAITPLGAIDTSAGGGLYAVCLVSGVATDTISIKRVGEVQLLSGASLGAGSELEKDNAGKFISRTTGDLVGWALSSASASDELFLAFIK